MRFTYKTLKRQLLLAACLFANVFSNLAGGNELPLQKENIFRIEHPPGIQYNSALIQNGKYDVLLYDSWKGYELDEGNLRYTQLKIAKGKIKFPPPLDISAEHPVKIRTSLSKVTISDIDWIYFIESEGFESEGKAYRAKFNDGNLQDRQEISLDIALSPSGNARWQAVNGDKVALVYTAKQCCKLYFGISDDGLKFKTPTYIGNTGFMPYLSTFSDGTLLYLFQKSFRSSQNKADGKPIFISKTHSRISHDDGKSWSDHAPIDLSDVTVHDAKAITRDDGNIDIYTQATSKYEFQSDQGASIQGASMKECRLPFELVQHRSGVPWTLPEGGF